LRLGGSAGICSDKDCAWPTLAIKENKRWGVMEG
jgi:hypothetical protein